MKQVVKKIIASLSVVLFVVITGLVSLTIFPQSLFANNIEHGKFRVYHDNEIDNHRLKDILDRAYSLVEKSELHDPQYRFNVFLAYGNIFNRIEDLQGKGPSARATAGNIVIKVPVDIENNLALSSISRINLTELIAHEMIHNLQANRYRLWNFSPIKHPPLWKLEGYPEYIARQRMRTEESYSLETDIRRCLEIEKAPAASIVEVVKDHFMPAYYFKGRVMIEYLINIEGMTYDQILSDNRTEEEVFNSMLRSISPTELND